MVTFTYMNKKYTNLLFIPGGRDTFTLYFGKMIHGLHSTAQKYRNHYMRVFRVYYTHFLLRRECKTARAESCVIECRPLNLRVVFLCYAITLFLCLSN